MKNLDIHTEAASRLAALDQRYTRGRRSIVDALERAARPLTVPEILDASGDRSVPMSSAYRNLNVLLDAGVVHRVAGADEFARYELAERLAGHHHHLMCGECGAVIDVPASARLENALRDAAALVAGENDFEVTGHRIDLLGRCAKCRG
jgi:Fur family ferric uptake transcriptional regulator